MKTSLITFANAQTAGMQTRNPAPIGSRNQYGNIAEKMNRVSKQFILPLILLSAFGFINKINGQSYYSNQMNLPITTLDVYATATPPNIVANAGTKNTGFGNSNGYDLSSGSYNCLFGYYAGNGCDEGSGNIFIGYQSGLVNGSSSYNTFVGYNTGVANTVSYNHFIGYAAGESNTDGVANHFDGYEAGQGNIEGEYNYFSGFQAGNLNHNASNNHFTGYQAGMNNYDGANNYYSGFQAGINNSSGSYNLGIGYQAGYTNSTHDGNFCVGYQAGYTNDVANNHFEGYKAGYSNSSGIQNFFVGSSAGYHSTQSYNHFLGFNSGYNTASGTYDQFDGCQAGYTNNSGSYNYFSGYQAGYKNYSASYNCYIGYQSGYSGETTPGGTPLPTENTFVGYQSGYDNVGGINNSYFGHTAGVYSLGDHNSFFGAETGLADATGDHLTLIGNHANVGGNLTYATAVGSNVTVANSYEMKFGEENITTWGFGVNPASGNAFEVGTTAANGNGAFLTSSGTWTNTSDVNKKENFVELNGEEILSKVDNLPITRWNYKGDAPSIQHIGPMAQDFYSLFNVGNNNKSISTIDPAGVALVSVKALHVQTQDLQKKNIDLLNQINGLVTQNQALQQQLNSATEKLESQQAQIDNLVQGIEQLKDMQAQCCNLQQQGNNNTGTINDQPSLQQNAPNPFTRNTAIDYYLPINAGPATISVQTLDGKVVMQFNIAGAGNGNIQISGGTLTPGTYIYNLIVSGKQVDSKKMILIGQ